MSLQRNAEPQIATVNETAEVLAKLRSLDTGNMLNFAVELPTQIIRAIQAAKNYHHGDIPLDHTSGHLVGLGGSAIAGELLEDMMAPKRNINIHRGTLPQSDRCGVVISSYSGNTDEILEIAPRLIGGLKSVIFFTSGGELVALGRELGTPVWLMPPNYAPRSAVGWSIGYLVALFEYWRILVNAAPKLERAAQRLATSIEKIGLEAHPLIRAALPIAKLIKNKNTILFHTLRCQGAANRLSSQLAENGKQISFPIALPEGMHNLVEGIAGIDPSQWTLLFMSDQGDPPSLKASVQRMMSQFTEIGFVCRSIPYTGDDQFEVTLSRVILSDFISLFLAAEKGVDPAPIDTIRSLKIHHDFEPEAFEGKGDSVVNHYSLTTGHSQ